MELTVANLKEFYIIREMIQTVINTVYPNYYPAGVVNFFLDHHSDENIKKDIELQKVFLLKVGDEYVGTGSVNENQINRVFVLPQYQGKGCGTYIMDRLEEMIAQQYHRVVLDSSLPAYHLYLQRGYRSIQYKKQVLLNGNVLCCFEMEKDVRPRG